MDEPTLESRIATERARALGLEARIANRRAAETAELELLESGRSQVTARHREFEAHIVSVNLRSATLTHQAEALERGLSRVRRSWVSLAEPVLGATSLFFAIAFVRLTRSTALTAAVEGLSFIGGAVVTSLARAWTRRT